MKEVYFIYSDKDDFECHGSYDKKWRAKLAIIKVLWLNRYLKRKDVFIFVEDDEEALANGVSAGNKCY